MRFLLLAIIPWCNFVVNAQTAPVTGWERMELRRSLPLEATTERCGHLFTQIDNRLYRSIDQGVSWTDIAWPGDSIHAHRLLLGEDGPLFYELDILSGNGTHLNKRGKVYGYSCGSLTFQQRESFDFSTSSTSSGGSQQVGVAIINGAFRLIRSETNWPAPGLTVYQVKSSIDGYTWENTYSETSQQGISNTNVHRYPSTRILPAHYRNTEAGSTYRLALADSLSALPLPTQIGAAFIGDTVSYVDGQGNWQYRLLSDTAWQSVPLPLPDVHLYGQWNGRYLLATPDALYRTDRPSDIDTYEVLTTAAELGSPISAFRSTSTQVLVGTAAGSTFGIKPDQDLQPLDVTLRGVQTIVTRNDSLLVQSDDRWFVPTDDGRLRPYAFDPDDPRVIYTDGDSMTTFQIIKASVAGTSRSAFTLVRRPANGGTTDTLRRDTLHATPQLVRNGASLVYTAGNVSYYSDDQGGTFTTISLAGHRLLHIDSLGQWVGGSGDSLYYSTDQGASWLPTGNSREGVVQGARHLQLFQSGLSPVGSFLDTVGHELSEWVPLERKFVQTDTAPFLQPLYSNYADRAFLRLDGRYHLAASALVGSNIGDHAYLLGGPFDRAIALPIPYRSTRFVASYPIVRPYTLAFPYQVRKAGPTLYARGDAGVWRAELCTLIDSSYLQKQVPLCEGGSVQLAGDTLFESGTYIRSLAIDPGCTVEEQTIVYQVDSLIRLPDLSYCRTAPYPFFDQLLDQSGTYSHTATVNGCPQRTELTLEREVPDTIFAAGAACPYRYFTFEGQSFPVGISQRVRPGPDCDTVLQVTVIELERPVTYDTIALTAGSVFAGQTIYTATEVVQQLYGAAANGCDSIVYTYVDILSSTEAAVWEQLRVFPNPATDHLTVVGLPATDGRSTRIRLYDSYGRTHYRNQAATGALRIDVRELPPGVYWLAVDHSGQNTYRKIIH